MSEWQPIETAPRDGTAVMIYDEGDIFVARWSEHDGIGHKYEDGFWLSTSCADQYYGTSDATHWMPLPEPPTDARP